MNHSKSLLGLPNEILLYIFRNFLDLADIWCLYQTSSELRRFASTVIQTTWKIETGHANIMKLQCRTALITLELLSKQLSFQHQKSHIHLDKNGYFIIEHQNTSTAIVKFLTHGFNAIKDEHNEEEEDDDDSEDEEENSLITCQRTAIALVINHSLKPPQKCTQQKSDRAKEFEQLLSREERLHKNMIRGISSYQHQFVLIEDIDLRNRIRTTVDIVFHHAVFVSAISRRTCVTSAHRAFSALLVRLLTRMDLFFSCYCREITYTLADNIKAFLEFTGYKLLTQCPSDMTLHSISACFDLMGAAFVSKILSDNHVECAVQRICELLSSRKMARFKRDLLTNLLDHWITIKREVGSTELSRYIRMEIEKSNRFL